METQCQRHRPDWLDKMDEAREPQRLPDNAEIILDLSRLLSRMLHTRPTGVDRVEMAYARMLIKHTPHQTSFAAVNPLGFYGRLDRGRILRFLDETEERWKNHERVGRMALRRGALLNLLRLWPTRSPRKERGVSRYYLQASPHHLHRPDKVIAKLRREEAEFICLVHDLIPIEYPEYARPNGADLHRRRMSTMARYAAGLIANSAATANSMRSFLNGSSEEVLIRPALLGGERPTMPVSSGDGPKVNAPYFIVISTIEPRKNHILLLNLWRRMAEERGEAQLPNLVIIGRRGWENENVVDMLERCEAMRGHVFEYNGLSDMAMMALLRGASALLCPSFAEGFGMPITEALVCGTPVICSDLPALREAGGGVPDYLDPLDGPAWLKAIVAYAAENSPEREAQMERMAHWRMPTWDDHISVVYDMIRDLEDVRVAG